MERRKFAYITGIRTPTIVVQPATSRYTDCVLPAPSKPIGKVVTRNGLRNSRLGSTPA
jgi:hypothetical protein